MRIILHIGTAKTGTTSLQTALHGNARALAKVGILYPTPPSGRRNHNLLTTVLNPPGKVQREFLALGDGTEDSIRAVGWEYWREVTRQIQKSRADVVILSGEYFFDLRDEGVIELGGLLHDLADEVQIVCYVRDPASYYVAQLQQQVKASYAIRTPGQFTMRAEVCLSRYLDAFSDCVFVRSAHRSSLVAGDIVSDFVRTYIPRASGNGALEHAPELNTSMSAEAMCIVQSLRRHGWPDRNGQFMKGSNHVIRLLNDMSARSPQTDPSLRPDIHARFLDKHREDLRFLRRQFDLALTPSDEDSVEAIGTPPGWTSGDLREILDVERHDVDRVLFELMEQLATSAAS